MIGKTSVQCATLGRKCTSALALPSSFIKRSFQQGKNILEEMWIKLTNNQQNWFKDFSLYLTCIAVKSIQSVNLSLW